jgi:hypothetical protein
MARLRLVNIFPDLAAQIRASFVADALPRLAGAIDTLEIVAPCGCSDSSCGSFHTSEEHYLGGPYPPGALTEETRDGALIDVLGDQILFIELLGSPDIHERLMQLFPGAK